jgi:hypothetical protein
VLPLLASVRVGGPSGKAPVIDLSSSSDEDDPIAATSHDFEFAQRLFGKLNRVVLRPPGNGKVIVLDDSDEEKEVQEEKIVRTEPAATSVAINPASTAFVLRMIRSPIRRLTAATTAEVALVSLRLPRQRPRC